MLNKRKLNEPNECIDICSICIGRASNWNACTMDLRQSPPMSNGQLSWGLIVLLVLILLSGIMMLGVLASNVSDGRNNEAYIAWCKLTGRNDMTKEELFALKRRGLLNVYYKADNQLNNK